MNKPRHRSVFAQHSSFLVIVFIPPWLVLYGLVFRALGLWSVDTQAPLPDYQLTVQGNPDGAVARLHTSDTLRIGLRPQQRVSGPVELHSLLMASGRSHPWPVTFEAQEGGGFLLQAPVSKLPGLQPGRWQLVLHIDRPGFWHRVFHDPTGPGESTAGLTVQVPIELTAN